MILVPALIFFLTYELIRTQLKVGGGLSVGLLSSLSMQLFHFWYFVLCTLGTLAFLYTHMCVLNSGRPLDSIGISPLILLVAQLEKNLPVMQETLVRFLGQEDHLEKG